MLRTISKSACCAVSQWAAETGGWQAIHRLVEKRALSWSAGILHAETGRPPRRTCAEWAPRPSACSAGPGAAAAATLRPCSKPEAWPDTRRRVPSSVGLHEDVAQNTAVPMRRDMNSCRIGMRLQRRRCPRAHVMVPPGACENTEEAPGARWARRRAAALCWRPQRGWPETSPPGAAASPLPAAASPCPATPQDAPTPLQSMM